VTKKVVVHVTMKAMAKKVVVHVAMKALAGEALARS
jgi:hypothetical protein